MTLTQDQVTAIQSGKSVHLLEPQSGTECVLVPAEVFRRVEAAILDAPFSSEERLALLAESGMRAGWNDPGMDVYDHYDAHKK